MAFSEHISVGYMYLGLEFLGCRVFIRFALVDTAKEFSKIYIVTRHEPIGEF